MSWRASAHHGPSSQTIGAHRCGWLLLKNPERPGCGGRLAGAQSPDSRGSIIARRRAGARRPRFRRARDLRAQVAAPAGQLNGSGSCGRQSVISELAYHATRRPERGRPGEPICIGVRGISAPLGARLKILSSSSARASWPGTWRRRLNGIGGGGGPALQARPAHFRPKSTSKQSGALRMSERTVLPTPGTIYFALARRKWACRPAPRRHAQAGALDYAPAKL